MGPEADGEEEGEKIMPLNMKKDSMGSVIKDFYKSDAPQFRGKSKKKRRQMAIAAKLEAERGSVKEGVGLAVARAIDKTKPPVGRPSIRRKISDALKMREVDKIRKKKRTFKHADSPGRKSFKDFAADIEKAKNKK